MFDPELIQSSKTTSISNKIEKPKIDYCVLNYFSNIYTCNFFSWYQNSKLVRTYPHIVEKREISMAPLFSRLLSRKSPQQSIKIFVKLDVLTKALAFWFAFVYTESY